MPRKTKRSASLVPTVSTEVIDFGKISKILNCQINYNLLTEKCVASMTILTVDGRQHTLNAQLSSGYISSFLDIIRETFKGISPDLPSS